VCSPALLRQCGRLREPSALARSIMAHDDLAAGRLVRLFPEISLASPLAYYVVYFPCCSVSIP